MLDRGDTSQTKLSSLLYLQVHTQKALPLGVLKVVLHEEVEQARSFPTYTPQFGHAAL